MRVCSGSSRAEVPSISYPKGNAAFLGVIQEQHLHALQCKPRLSTRVAQPEAKPQGGARPNQLVSSGFI